MREIIEIYFNHNKYKGLIVLVLIFFATIFLYGTRPIMNVGKSSGEYFAAKRDFKITVIDSNILYDAICLKEYHVRIKDSSILDSINIVYGITKHDTMIIIGDNAITKTGNEDYNVILSLLGFVPEINVMEQLINSSLFPYYLYFMHNYNLPEPELNDLIYKNNTSFTNMVNTIISISTIPSWLKTTDIILSHLSNIGLGVIAASYTSRVFNCTEAGVPIGICCTLGFSLGTIYALIGIMLGKSEAELVYLINNTDILQKEIFLNNIKQFNDFINIVLSIEDYEIRYEYYTQYTDKITIKKNYYYEY